MPRRDALIAVNRLLVSVYDKSELLPFMDFMTNRGAEIISTGGTANTLREAKLQVMDVSTLTGFPECFGGRVKTLHPKVHGGLLYRRKNPGDVAESLEHRIKPIDLLVVNLYPFVAKVASGAGWDECIENIDIGGPAMIRAAAKNSESVAVVTAPAQYQLVMNDVRLYGGTTYELRRRLMQAAYLMCSEYDAAVAAYLSSQNSQAGIS